MWKYEEEHSPNTSSSADFPDSDILPHVSAAGLPRDDVLAELTFTAFNHGVCVSSFLHAGEGTGYFYLISKLCNIALNSQSDTTGQYVRSSLRTAKLHLRCKN